MKKLLLLFPIVFMTGCLEEKNIVTLYSGGCQVEQYTTNRKIWRHPGHVHLYDMQTQTDVILYGDISIKAAEPPIPRDEK